MTVLEALKKYFGYDEFRPAQIEIIKEILSGKNVLSILPTGAGKSICYQIPALISENYSIVISPLIALMKDQVDAINKSEEIAGFINSTQSFAETEKVLNDIAYGKIKLVYIAPEKLENTEFALRLKNLNPNFLFIDEAHCISEWGHNFRPSYTKLKNFIEFTGIKKISAFTATATPEVVKDIIKQLGIKNSRLIIKGFERDNLFVNVEIIKKKKERCVELIHKHRTPAIIYTSSRKKAEELAEYLLLNKINCQYYHAGLDPIIRKKIQDDFIGGNIPVIVATNAFGMGIDKKNIRLVIHFNVPGTIENYYQEIGRAGRDGKNSYTYLLYEESDIQIHNYFISNSYPTKELIKGIYDAICDYQQIAIGNKTDKDISINSEFIKLYVKHDISKAILHSSLRYLEEAGYLRINSAFKSKNRIKIIFEPNRLKNFIKKTSNILMKDLLLYLVKNIGNDIFIKPSIVDFNSVQIETGFTLEEIENTLSNLEYLGILEFYKADGKETISLLQPRINSDELKLNYKLINEFYINSKQKLEKIVDYVYTDECRFKFILKYFGESITNYKCGKCDNCLKENTLSDISYDYIKTSILELLNNFENPLTEKEIVNNFSEKTLSLTKNHSIKLFSKNEIKTALNILLNENSVKTLRKGSKTLYKTEKYLSDTNENNINFSEETQLTDYEQNIELFHQLRNEREKASKKFLQSPHIICSDSILSKISQIKPRSKSELLKIDGFNERMFNKIGEEFLNIINSVDDNKIKSTNDKSNNLPANIKETYFLLKKKHTLHEISKLRKLTEAVISMQIETIISYLPETKLNRIITDEELKMIKEVYEKGSGSLKELKENLPDNFTYPLIRIGLAKIKAQRF